ncbi:MULTISPECIES: M13 family metallopeptidase [unclassified Flavobacterium]|uniref:M13 family metallopeptidase n=1 Tax=unclassified Flavobacterium TaxID=196869 RepID=UPI001F131812|nr:MULTISPECIES: M13 family metallopeptidase [unclassified Flavobacterium]UMY66151.1 M13 family metallopeptidase [Flavobacterium sp. HJ-32-4]
MIKKNIAIAAAAALVLASCGKDEKLKSGVLLANMDTLVKPGDDFDAYVNGGWVKKNKIPADKAAYGVFEMLDDKAQENVKAIIEEAAKGDFADGSNEQKIGDFYASFLDVKGRDAKGLTPLQPELAKIDAIKTYDDLAAYFGAANATGFGTPIGLGIIGDFKDPTKNMLYVWQGGLGLPEREYYVATDAKSKEIRDKYVAHITRMMQLAGWTGGEESARNILAFETKLAQQHMKKEETRQTTLLYNKFKVADLKTLSPTFNWSLYLKSAGVTNATDITICQVNYVKALDGIMTQTPIDVWKTWLKWSALHAASGSLTSALDKEDFDFYDKTLYGITEQKPMWRRAVEAVNGSLGEIVGQVYVKKHFSPEAKDQVKDLVDNLLKAYKSSIENLDWMTPATKKEALDKLSKITVKIGYPDKWRDYAKLEVKKDDYFGNQMRSSVFEYQRQLEKLGKPVDKSEWTMNPQTINAYYNPLWNEIVFPAAILQPPFFDAEADPAVNYGSIGAVIGHEIGHGFDDQGSGFDGDGVMRDWWTKEDRAAFQKKTAALIGQYDAFKVFPDLNVNGTYTQGENIGDLGGCGISYKAYQMSLNGKTAPKIDGFSGDQRFFIGYAQSWLSKMRDEYLRTLVATNPHAPDHFRVIGILRNIPEWYTAFNVKPGDKMYLAPEKRVKIW